MSRESYLSGFVKKAQASGVDPNALAQFLNGLAAIRTTEKTAAEAPTASDKKYEGKDLIIALCAIECAAKDWHYASRGDTFHGNHKLADDVYDGRAGEQDDLQELFFLAHGKDALSGKEKLTEAAKLLTHDPKSYVSSRQACADLLVHGMKVCTSLEGDKSLTTGERNVVCTIAENLEKVFALVNKQISNK